MSYPSFKEHKYFKVAIKSFYAAQLNFGLINLLNLSL